MHTLKPQFQLANQELYIHERIWPGSKLSLPCSLLQRLYYTRDREERNKVGAKD